MSCNFFLNPIKFGKYKSRTVEPVSVLFKSMKVHVFWSDCHRVLVEAVRVYRYFPPSFLSFSSILFSLHLFPCVSLQILTVSLPCETSQKTPFFSLRSETIFASISPVSLPNRNERRTLPHIRSSITFYLQIRVLPTKTVQIRTPNIFLKLEFFIYFRCSCGWWASYFLPWLLCLELSPPTSTDSDTSPGTAHLRSPGRNSLGVRQVRKQSWSLRAVSSERHQSRNSTPPESR